jgi:hypothetical protein
MIPSQDLTVADDILYSTAGARIKRPGFVYMDDGELPAVSSISLTSNVVTVTFASSINDGTNNKLVAGEKITVACTTNSGFNVTDVAISTASGTSVTYPKTNANIGSTSSPTITITRSSTIIGHHDFWYYNSSTNTKAQLILAMTSQGKLFKYTGTASATRLEVTRKTYALTANTVVAAPAVFTITGHGLYTGCAIAFTSITGGSGGQFLVETDPTTPVYYVEKIDADTFYLADSPGGSRKSLTGSNITAGTIAVPFGQTTPITSCAFKAFNEKLFITSDGIKNWPIMFDPVADATTYTMTKGANPNASVVQVHEGRLVMNDKTTKDRIHYCSPFNHLEWQGVGDSGVIDFTQGDGDPSGIVSILPPFRGALFVSKSRTMYRLPDPGIANSRIELVSGGIGAIAHNGVATIDLDDLVFMSERGFHSLNTTSAYGDFSGSFLSEKIQPSFADFVESRRKYTSAQYFPKHNLVFFSVAEDDSAGQDMLWCYNTKYKEWVRWTGLAPSFITQYKTSSSDRVLIATTDCRLAYLSDSTYSDFGTEHINYLIRSGKIYVDGNPNSTKTFKRLGLLFPPKGAYNVSVVARIDNQTVDTDTNSLTFSRTSSGDTLGETFTLGMSTLSYTANLDPFMLPIDGVGRGISVAISNDGDGEQVEIYGLLIEWVPAGMTQETHVSGSTTE